MKVNAGGAGRGRYEEVVILFALFDALVAKLQSLFVGSALECIVNELILAVVRE